MQKKITQSLPSRLARVIEEAEALFVEEGFLHFSTEQLARRLRCSKRTLYRIAPTREKFFELVLERWYTRRSEEMIAAAAAAPNCVAALTAFAERAISFGGEADRFFRDARDFPGGIRAFNRSEKQLLESLQGLVTEGIRTGAFRRANPALVANVLVAAGYRVTDPRFLSQQSLNWSEALRQMNRLLLEGLLAGHEVKESQVSTSDRRGRSRIVRQGRALKRERESCA